MSIDKNPPRTIMLSGELDAGQTIDDYPCAVGPITPGYLVERASSGGVEGWQANSSATNQVQMFVALEQDEVNKTIDDAYATGDLMHVGRIEVGDVIYGILPSGVTANYGTGLQSNGDGKFKAATAATATANVQRFQSLDDLGAVNVDTRCRIERTA